MKCEGSAQLLAHEPRVSPAPVAGESKPPGVGSPAASAQARLAYSQPREKSLVAVEERRKEDQKIAAGARLS